MCIFKTFTNRIWDISNAFVHSSLLSSAFSSSNFNVNCFLLLLTFSFCYSSSILFYLSHNSNSVKFFGKQFFFFNFHNLFYVQVWVWVKLFKLYRFVLNNKNNSSLDNMNRYWVFSWLKMKVFRSFNFF